MAASNKPKKDEPVADFRAMCGFVQIFGQGKRNWIAPWTVVRITEGTTKGAGTISCDPPVAGCGYEGYENGGEEVAQLIWDGMKRAAATALLANMHKEGIKDVVEALQVPFTKQLSQSVDTGITARLDEVLKTEILAVLQSVAADDVPQ